MHVGLVEVMSFTSEIWWGSLPEDKRLYLIRDKYSLLTVQPNLRAIDMPLLRSGKKFGIFLLTYRSAGAKGRALQR